MFTMIGCSKDSETGKQAEKAPEVDLKAPVNLSFYASSSSMTKDLFEAKIANPVKEKYPNYTFTYIQAGSKLADLIATGTIPDFFWLSLTEMRNVIFQYKFQYDLMEPINKQKYDLNRFDAAAVQTIRNVSGEGKMLGLPDSFNPMVLFYNKDIFDKFGIGYPTNGMTWDAAYDLARKMTRTESGVSYRGMGMYFRLMFNGNQLSLPLIDPESAKPLLSSTPGWKRILDNTKRFYDIEGNKLGWKSGSDGNNDLISFINDRTTAMIVSPLSSYNRDGFQKLNWDMAAVPTFPDLPKVGMQSEPRMFFIANTAKAKEQAFQAITYLLSDEVQTKNNKDGQLTSLKSDAILKTFGQQTPALSGKNNSAVYFNQFAPTPAFKTGITTDPATILAKEFDLVLTDKEDVNTAMRNADEKIKLAIEAENAK
jgi:multiple sugar transport system substrate-binding protein